MKIRKHKNNRPFEICFQTLSVSSEIVAHKGNVGGWEKREITRTLSQIQFDTIVGNSAGSVRNGFLFGRDRNNTIIRYIA